jgi:hypothetical protein
MYSGIKDTGQSEWPRCLRRRSSAVRLLGIWVRIPLGEWMSVCCECLCCQVEVSVSGWSLVQRSPTECGVSKRVWLWSSERTGKAMTRKRGEKCHVESKNKTQLLWLWMSRHRFSVMQYRKGFRLELLRKKSRNKGKIWYWTQTFEE